MHAYVQASSFHLSALRQQHAADPLRVVPGQSPASDERDNRRQGKGTRLDDEPVTIDWAHEIDWVQARGDYFYFNKIMAEDLGGNCAQRKASEGRGGGGGGVEGLREGGKEASSLESCVHSAAQPSWLRRGDDLVRRNPFCNSDIRSHLKELYVFTLFFSPRVIVELGVRSGWSSRAFSAAAKLVGAKMVGVDLSEGCKDVYGALLSSDKEVTSRVKLVWKTERMAANFTQQGFAVAADSAEAAADYPLWVADRQDVGLPATVDLLFIDTSHLYQDTVRELAAWAPLLSRRSAIILHDTNLAPSRVYVRKVPDPSLSTGMRGERVECRDGMPSAHLSYLSACLSARRSWQHGSVCLCACLCACVRACVRACECA